MNYNEKWEIVEKIGEGGQGKVFRVYDKSVKEETDKKIVSFLNSIKVLHVDDIESNLDEFINLIYKRLETQNISSHKALKILHTPIEARDFQLAKNRIRNELKAMHDIKHDHLLNIIDYDNEENWFVANYYSKGTLDKNLNQFYGNAILTLKLVRQ